MKNKFNLISLITFLISVFWFGCQEQVMSPDSDSFKIQQQLSTANGENSEPTIVDLFAGQDILVGYIEVSNDETNLYVNFVITADDWCLEETHLAVATTVDGIPQTKKGNPIPGQFVNSHSDLGCVMQDPYTILLSEIYGYKECGGVDPLIIAAHAVVKSGTEEILKIGSGMDGITTTVLERRAGNVAGFTEVNTPAMLAWEPGPSYPNDGANDSGWEDWSLWDGRLSSNVFRPDGSDGTDAADWIWESDQVLDPIFGTVLKMETKFDICEPGSATLYIATDNGFEVFLNGTSLGKNLVVGDDWQNSNLYEASVKTAGWENVKSYTLDLVAGTNTLQLDVANEYLNPDDDKNNIVGTVSSNPGAVIFLIDGNSTCYSTCYQFETAWGEGPGFPGNNWATYIEYETSCPPVCDQWIVYGSNLNAGASDFDDAIYAYDLKEETQELVYDPTPIDGHMNYPNANAYDYDNQRIYFGTDDGRLFYHQIGSGTHVQVEGGATSGTFGSMACGGWYNGKFYYIQNGTNRLYEVTIIADVATRTQIGTVPTSAGYGDIAFDPANEGVFVASAGSVWYAYNVNTGDDWDLIIDVNGDIPAKHLQLAYGSDGVLYGVNATTGQFFSIVYDTDANTVTLDKGWDSPYTYTDLASGPKCQ